MGARRTDVRAAWASRVGARRMHESAEPAVAPPYAHKHVDTRSSGRCSSPSSQRSRSGLSQFDPREFVSREAGGSQRVCAAPSRCRFHDALLDCETHLSSQRFSRGPSNSELSTGYRIPSTIRISRCYSYCRLTTDLKAALLSTPPLPLNVRVWA